MKLKFYKRIFGGLLSFLLFSSQIFLQAKLEGNYTSGTDIQVQQDSFKDLMNAIMGVQNPDQNTNFNIQELLAELQKSFDDRIRQEFEEKLKLLPDKYKKLFQKQESAFEKVNNVMQLENYIVQLLDNINLNLKQSIKSDSDAKNITKEILGILNVVYFCLEKGYVNTFIQNGFLKGINNKIDQVTTFSPFRREKFKDKSSLYPKFSTSILKHLKEYIEKINLYKQNFSVDEDIYKNLAHLNQILLSFVNNDFSGFLNISIQGLKKQVDVVKQKINLGYLEFKNYYQNLLIDNLNNQNDEQIKVFQFFIDKLEFYKKALENFYSYKESLDLQTNIGYQFFYKSFVYTYDFFGRLEKYLTPSKYAFFSRRVPLRGVAAMAYFFDAYILSKGISLLDVLKGNSDLKDVTRSKMELQILALMKSVFIMFSTQTFSFDKIWMIGSIMQLGAAFTYYHLKNGGGQVLWPNNDRKINRAICSILRNSKKSASRFVEGFIWKLNPVLIEKIENKTVGIVSPDIIRLIFDLFSPSLFNNHFPVSIADLHRDNANDFGFVANNVGAEGRNFIETKHSIREIDLQELHFNEEQIEALQNYGFRKIGQAGWVWKAQNYWNRNTPEWWKVWKRKENNHRRTYTINGVEFSEQQKKILDAYIAKPKYTKAEFIEGKIVGYIFSQFGNHIARSFVKNNRSSVGRFIGKIIDKTVLVFNKIGLIKSPKEKIEKMKKEFVISMDFLKGMLANMIYSTQDSEFIGIFLYNAAGFKLISYSKAMNFFKLINNNQRDVIKLHRTMDALFEAIADRIYGNIAGWVGSKFMMMLGSYTMNKWGPFYPRVHAAF